MLSETSNLSVKSPDNIPLNEANSKEQAKQKFKKRNIKEKNFLLLIYPQEGHFYGITLTITTNMINNKLGYC